MKTVKKIFKSEVFKRSMAVFGCMLLLVCTVAMPAAAETITGVDEVDTMMTTTNTIFYGVLKWVGGLLIIVGIIVLLVSWIGGHQLADKVTALGLLVIGIVCACAQQLLNAFV